MRFIAVFDRVLSYNHAHSLCFDQGYSLPLVINPGNSLAAMRMQNHIPENRSAIIEKEMAEQWGKAAAQKFKKFIAKLDLIHETEDSFFYMFPDFFDEKDLTLIRRSYTTSAGPAFMEMEDVNRLVAKKEMAEKKFARGQIVRTGFGNENTLSLDAARAVQKALHAMLDREKKRWEEAEKNGPPIKY